MNLISVKMDKRLEREEAIANEPEKRGVRSKNSRRSRSRRCRNGIGASGAPHSGE